MITSNNVFKNVSITDDFSNQLADSGKKGYEGKTYSIKTLYPNLVRAYLGDARDVKLHDANFAFLTTALAKLSPKLLEPKWYITYARDIPVDTGGGFVDYVQYFTVSWAGIANEMRNVVGNGANYIPRVNAGMYQNVAYVYTFEIAYDIRFVELEKMKKLTLQKSLEEIYRDAIAAAWGFFVQKVAYTGGDDNHYGLFNHTDKVPLTVTSLSKQGIIDGTVSDTALAGLINGIIEKSLENSNMNAAVLPDTFLVPTWFGSALTGRFSNLYTNSLRSYLIEHNLAVDETGGAVKITIESRPQLNTLGAAGAGRIVAYKKDKDFVRLDIPYPMKHYITLPNIERMGYTSAFIGQVSEIQLPYTTSNTDESSPVQYYDFIA